MMMSSGSSVKKTQNETLRRRSGCVLDAGRNRPACWGTSESLFGRLKHI